MKVAHIVAGTGSTIRVKSHEGIVNGLTDGGINFTGYDIVLEGGDKGIGVAKAITVDMLAGSLVARATLDVKITAPDSNLLINSIYSESGNAYLTATKGSILDALGTDNEKVRANHIWLSAGGSIGTSTDALEINVTGAYAGNPQQSDPVGTVIASARTTSA